jgi:K+-sensing histidine kinase KdpD
VAFPRGRLFELAGYVAAVVVPAALTAVLVWTGGKERDYVFLYMGVVAVLAFLRGLWPSLLAAATSFLLVDFFFVPPVHTLTVTNGEDVVNLIVFFGTAGIVGTLASLRRRTLLQAQRLARELQLANAELVRLNREQAETAEAALHLARTQQQIEILRQTEQYHHDLLASVSHDLRTPIGSILTDSTNMLRTQTMNASVRHRIEAIAKEARRLGQLVGDMLDMARIEGNALALNLEPVQLAYAITSSIDRLHKTSPERAVEWSEEDAAVSVLGDWDRLGQIFDNLLSNADRFAPPGTPIAVRVSQEEPGFVTIHVVDSGPGVPPELRDRLFNRFVKGDAHAGGGTGLGLAIARGLVEAHAGKIVLEDHMPVGAAFRFTLPKADQ